MVDFRVKVRKRPAGSNEGGTTWAWAGGGERGLISSVKRWVPLSLLCCVCFGGAWLRVSQIYASQYWRTHWLRPSA